MFLIGQNVFYGGGFAGLAYLEHCGTGMAKTVEHSYAYQKCREKDTKPSSASDINNTCGESMDKALAEAARGLVAVNLFDLVRENYCKVNHDYLQKQITIASEYLSEEQKEQLRGKGYEI